MLRTIQLSALAGLAVLAVTAVVTSGASAEPTKFTSGSSSGFVVGTQTTKFVFTTNGGKVECTTASQEGTYTSASFTSFTVGLAFSGCTAFGFLNATIAPNGCTFFYAGKEQKPGEETLNTVTIGCPLGKQIVITGGSCTTTVPSQGPLNHAKVGNNTLPVPDDVNGTATLSGITYTTTGCISGNGTFNNGTMSGGSTFIARDTTGKQVNLTVEP